MKPRYKRRIAWSSAVILCGLALCVVILPPMMSFEYMRAPLESALSDAFGADAKVSGEIRMSLLGSATINAKDIRVGDWRAKSIRVRVPLRAALSGSQMSVPREITVVGAKVGLAEIFPRDFGARVDVYDSCVKFLDREYCDLNGVFDGGGFIGYIRTNDHKYSIISDRSGSFAVSNANENLNISGNFYGDNDGVRARGKMSINTRDANRFFEIPFPQIKGRMQATADFDWDSAYKLNFSNISGNAMNAMFSGAISLNHGEWKTADLEIKNLETSLDFIEKDRNFLNGIESLRMRVSGKISFRGKEYNSINFSLKPNAGAFDISADTEQVKIKGWIDRYSLKGTVGYDFAELDITYNNESFCAYSLQKNGDWSCNPYKVGGASQATGVVTKIGGKMNVTMTAMSAGPNIELLSNPVPWLYGGHPENVEFEFKGLRGYGKMEKGKWRLSYSADRAALKDVPFLFPLVSDSMLGDIGKIAAETLGGNVEMLSFESPYWTLRYSGGAFEFEHKDIAHLLSDFYSADNSFIKPGIPIFVSGIMKEIDKNTKLGRMVVGYQQPYINISGMRGRIGVAGPFGNIEFSGGLNNGDITIETDTLDLDSFLSKDYFADRQRNDFLKQDPVLYPLSLDGLNISLSAKNVIVGGMEYSGFTYSLRDREMAASITDSKRGGLLLSALRNGTTYKILVQFGEFFIPGLAMPKEFGLNVADSKITGQAELETSGMIAHDVRKNMKGTLDLTFDGGANGYLVGIGTDKFFAEKKLASYSQAADMVFEMLSEGASRLKNISVIGVYENGGFRTTRPARITLNGATLTGNISVKDNKMNADLGLTLNGCPGEISVGIDGMRRDISLPQALSVVTPGCF